MTTAYPQLPENTKHSLIQQPSVPLTERTTFISSSSHLSVQSNSNQSQNSSEIQPLSSEEVNNAAINLCLEMGSIIFGVFGFFMQLFGLYVWRGLITEGVIPSLGTVFNAFYFISLILKLMECALAVSFGFTPSTQAAVKFYPTLRIVFWFLVISWGIFTFVVIVLAQLGFMYSSEVWYTIIGVLLAENISSTGAGLCTMLLMGVFNTAVSQQLQSVNFKNVFIAPPAQSNYIEMKEKF